MVQSRAMKVLRDAMLDAVVEEDYDTADDLMGALKRISTRTKNSPPRRVVHRKKKNYGAPMVYPEPAANIVLRALGNIGDGIYSEVRAEIRRNAGVDMPKGTVSSALCNMKDAGLVSGESDISPHGRTCWRWRVTQRGARLLADGAETAQQFLGKQKRRET